MLTYSLGAWYHELNHVFNTLQQVYSFNCLYHCDSTALFHGVPQYGWTALMLASEEGHTDVVQLLLSHGAQVELQEMVRHKHQLDSYVSSHS